jgi:hypothetical protein
MMMAKHIHVKVRLLDEDEKQAEIAKTARLRALRLGKEGADGGGAGLAIAAVPRPRNLRVTGE